MNLFEIASRKKYRFNSPKGPLTVEHLWGLPLTDAHGNVSLDMIAKSIFADMKDEGEVSFVEKSPMTDDTLSNKLDIVKHIIAVKLAEREAFMNQKAVAEKKRLLNQIIAEKENDELKGKSLDDLRKMAADLG